MSRYVDVPRDAVEARLEKAGFSRKDVRGEVTYIRRHDREPRLRVEVLTSVPEFDTDARGCGEDAIRVFALFGWKRQGEDVERIKKLFEARVYRVTSVEGTLERMIERAREAYARCNEWLKEQRR